MSQIDFNTYGSVVFFCFVVCCFGYYLFMVCCREWYADVYKEIVEFIVAVRSASFLSARRKPWKHKLKEQKKAKDLPLAWQTDFQNSASSQMEGIADLYADVMSFLAGIFFFVFFIIYFTIINWGVSYDNGSPYFIENKYFMYPKDWLYYNYNIVLEIIWTVIPALILVVIAIPSFSLLFSLEDDLGVSVWVKVVGAQWYWNYEFYEQNTFNTISSYMISEDDLLFGDLRLLQVDNWLSFKVNTAVKFFITSQDVLHSWAVPALGIKIDACPGRLNVITIFMKRAGIFYGQCSEICGINHAFMPIMIEVADSELEEIVKEDTIEEIFEENTVEKTSESNKVLNK